MAPPALRSLQERDEITRGQRRAGHAPEPQGTAAGSEGQGTEQLRQARLMGNPAQSTPPQPSSLASEPGTAGPLGPVCVENRPWDSGTRVREDTPCAQAWTMVGPRCARGQSFQSPDPGDWRDVRRVQGKSHVDLPGFGEPQEHDTAAPSAPLNARIPRPHPHPAVFSLQAP